MSHYVITGGTSFIGRRLVQKLTDRGDFVTVVCRPASVGIPLLPKSKNISIVELSLSDFSCLSGYLNHDVDAVFHLAWDGTRMPHRENAEIQRQNFRYTLDIYGTLCDIGASVFIGAGSQAEYGKVCDVVHEDTECSPDTQYGRYKLLSANHVIALGKKDNIRVVWPRIFSIYGPGDYDGTLIQSAIKKLGDGQPMNLTECIQMWDYMYVDDTADALIALLDNSTCSGIYNIASGKPRMLKEFICELKQILNSNSDLRFGAVPYGKHGPVQLIASVDKLQNDTGFFPKCTFSDGILQIINNI